MIEALVDLFSVLIQILIAIVVAAGAFMGYGAIPDSFHIGTELVEPSPVVKVVIGGGLSLLVAAIFLAPVLVLLDIRNSIRSIDRKTNSYKAQ